MSETVVNFNEIQRTLEPMFSGGFVRIIVENRRVVIFEENLAPKKLKARGIAKAFANPDLIANEKGAWERAAVEKYRERHGELSDDS